VEWAEAMSPLCANTVLITAFPSQSGAVTVKVQQFCIAWFMYLSYRRCWECSPIGLDTFSTSSKPILSSSPVCGLVQ
jgi:hypothetical protein